MWNRLMVLLALTATVCSAVNAAETKAAVAKATDAKTVEAAEAAAAMERARRMAANPLRVIVEASKVRRRAGNETDPGLGAAAAPAPAAPAAARASPAPAATPAAAPAATRSNANANANAGTITTTVAALPAAEVAPEVAAASSPASAPVALQAALQAAVQTPVQTSPQPPITAALPDAITPTAEAVRSSAAAAMVPVVGLSAVPKLRTMVEPNIPARLLTDIGRLLEVQADLTIRADGTVAAVSLVQPVPRQLVRYLVAAFEAWRFEPLPAEKQHRIQLVFNDN